MNNLQPAFHPLPDAREEARRMEGRANELEGESRTLKGAARLEDLTLWQMEKAKTTKKGSKTYLYWMASWREGDKVRNVHLGSCRKVDHETALQKARALKSEALAIKPLALEINQLHY